MAAALIAASVTAGAATTAQAQSEACQGPEYRQFDFWVGSWDLTWPGENGETVEGTNTISLAQDACAIIEQFASPSDDYTGTSLSGYNRFTGQWHQLWVDSGGAVLRFSGGMEGEQMVLNGDWVTPDGDIFRMVFFNIEDDTLDWEYQRSSDDGTTWETLWPIHYERAQ
jgi:hypothetical protein